MLTTVETIQISETTTSCRVEIGEVDFEATLDERYHQRCRVEESEAKATESATLTQTERDRAPSAGR